MPFNLSNPCGRLVEVRIHGLMLLDEAQQIRTGMYLLLSKLPGRAVIVTDMLRAEPFGSEVGDRMLEMLTHDNPKVERTAFIMQKSAFSFQIERICQDAARAARAADKVAPQRRVFFDKAALFAWLRDGLTAPELAHLTATMTSLT